MEGNTRARPTVPARGEVRPLAARPRSESCTFDQLDVPLNYDLYDVLES